MKELIVRGYFIMTGSNKTSFVIFGGTGDLTYRKLMPAFYDLFVLNQLKPEDFEIIIIGRRDYTNESYQETYEETILDFARLKNRDRLIDFRSLVTYYKMDFNEPTHYEGFKEYLLQRGDKALFYLAVSPKSFSVITDNLSKSGIISSLSSKQLLIEKPFGEDLQSAKEIDAQIKHCFKEDEIYRIDHYLAKEMMLNILTIRFGNKAFETLWNAKSIESIQISALEQGGVNERGNYYDQTGALEDMFQSHLLQMISYVLMDRPKSMNPRHLHKAQEKALSLLKPSSSKMFKQDFVKGQYSANDNMVGYLDEKYIDKESKTETFLGLVLHSENKAFKGVPIYVRTGKRAKVQSTYVAITFKPVKGIDGKLKDQNILIIRIGPDEGIYFKVNIKRPGNFNETQPISMDFCQSCIYENRLNTPQAYERLIQFALEKDRTLFASWPIVEQSWTLTQKIQEKAKTLGIETLLYPAGQNGPSEMETLVSSRNHEWVDDVVLGQYYED